MKLRQIDNEDQPVDRENVRPGEYIEHGDCIYVVAAPSNCRNGCNLDGSGYNCLMDHPIHRIRITGTGDDGKLAWERIANEPKPVTLDRLRRRETFCYPDPGGHTHVPCMRLASSLTNERGEGIVAVSLDQAVAFPAASFDGDLLYRAEPCGFDDETKEVLWRRI